MYSQLLLHMLNAHMLIYPTIVDIFLLYLCQFVKWNNGSPTVHLRALLWFLITLCVSICIEDICTASSIEFFSFPLQYSYLVYFGLLRILSTCCPEHLFLHMYGAEGCLAVFSFHPSFPIFQGWNYVIPCFLLLWTLQKDLGMERCIWVGSLKGAESGVKDALMAQTLQRDREEAGLCRGRRQTYEAGPTKPWQPFMEVRRECCLTDLALMPSPHSVGG